MDKLLLPYQRAWIADPGPVKVWEKSRRIGASWSDAGDSARVAARSREAGGMSTFYLAYNKDMTRQYVQDTASWARALNLAAGDFEEIVLDEAKDLSIFQVRFASGFVVQGLSSNPNNLRSKQGRVRIDEAAFVPDLAELLKAALALTMWGGDVAVLSTHNGEDNPFNQLVQDIRGGRLEYSLHRTTLDDALEQGLFRRICEVKAAREPDPARRAALAWSPEAEAAWRARLLRDYADNAAEELFCVPSRGGGAYLVRTVIEACMSPAVPVLRWAPPARDFVDWPEDSRWREMQAFCDGQLAPLLAGLDRERRHFLGQDFGRLVDLSVVWPLREMADLVLATPFVLELRDCPFTQQEQALFFLADRLPRFSGGALDAGGNGAYLAERARQRFGADRIAEVRFHEKWNLAHWPPLKAGLEDRMLLLPRDADILEDLRAVRTVRGVPGIPDKRGKDATGKRHGDAAVALVLAHHAARTLNAAGPIEVATAGPRVSAGLMRGWM